MLADFLAEVEFDHLGTYRYSPEAGTPAADLPGRVAPEEVADREARILDLQAEVAGRRMAARLGETHAVVLDEAETGSARAAELTAALADGAWLDDAARQRAQAWRKRGGRLALGRSHHFGYDLDGVVVLPVPAGETWRPGDWLEARFTGATPYDVWAYPVPGVGAEREPA